MALTGLEGAKNSSGWLVKQYGIDIANDREALTNEDIYSVRSTNSTQILLYTAYRLQSAGIMNHGYIPGMICWQACMYFVLVTLSSTVSTRCRNNHTAPMMAALLVDHIFP